MRIRLLGTLAALSAITLTAGCGLTGSTPNEPSQRSGKIAVGDTSRQTQLVKCTQVNWDMTIDANADPGSAHAFLRLGGPKPVVQTVNIQNIDGLNAISGGDVADAEASLRNRSVYTITGTAVVADPAHPGQTTKMPFTIEAPC